MNSLINLSDQRLVPSPRGLLVKNREGELFGLVGISGETSENDETCAIAGIEATGLIA